MLPDRIADLELARFHATPTIPSVLGPEPTSGFATDLAKTGHEEMIDSVQNDEFRLLQGLELLLQLLDRNKGVLISRDHQNRMAPGHQSLDIEHPRRRRD